MDIKTKAEVDRLLSAANVARLRGDYSAMEQACRDVVTLTGENAEIVELIGDALLGQGKIAESGEYFKKSSEMEPGRASAEIKYARTVLEAASLELQVKENLFQLDHPRDHQNPRHGLISTMILSMLLPGLGQLVAGDLVKGGIVLAAYVISLSILAVLPDTHVFVKQMLLLSSGNGSEGTGRGIGILFVCFLGVSLFCYIYAVMDVLVNATKGLKSNTESKSVPSPPQPPITPDESSK